MSNGKTTIGELLELLEILKQENIDVRAINRYKNDKVTGKQVATLLKDIKQEGIDINEIIQRRGLNPDYKIGIRLDGLIRAFRGKGTYAITEDEAKKAGELLKINTKTGTEQLFYVLECLKSEGVNMKRIKKRMIVNGKEVSTRLKDIEQKGIDINEIIKKYNLDGDYNIGRVYFIISKSTKK